MTNNPNRTQSRATATSRNPMPEEIRATREAAELPQAEAGDRRTPSAFWELFRIKAAMRNARS